MWLYKDRKEAGRKLAEILQGYQISEPVVLAIPNGGVPVAQEVALTLKCPWHLVVVKKMSIDENPDLSFGSVTVSGKTILNSAMLNKIAISPKKIQEKSRNVWEQIQRQLANYNASQDFSFLKGKTAIVIDDGIATGITMEAALKSIESFNPKYTIFAVPTGAAKPFEKLCYEVDAGICLNISYKSPHIISEVYQDYSEIDEEAVKKFLSCQKR